MEHCYKTFISIGNAKQHFSRLLNSIESLADVLPQPVLVQHGHTPFQSTIFQSVDFIAMDEFTDYVNNADILIFHAGAGSVLHAIKARKQPIVVPRKAEFNEHVNDHQVSFAKMLDEEGRVMMVDDVTELRLAIKRIQENKSSFLMADYKSRAIDVLNNLLIDLLHKPSKDLK